MMEATTSCNLGVHSLGSSVDGDERRTLSSPFSTLPFDPSEMKRLSGGIDGWDKSFTYATIASDDKLYALLLTFIPRVVADADRRSLSCFAVSNGGDSDSDNDDDDDDRRGDNDTSTGVKAGLGLFRFEAGCKSGATREFFALHQTLGAPVGARCGAELYTQLVVFVKGAGCEEHIRDLTDELVARSEVSKDKTFGIYRWDVRHGYWRRDRVVKARAVESVVLPAETKAALLGDVADFLSRDTRAWYNLHCIPYNRSYLFYGTPGTGKTSTIAALAGLHKRSVCYLVASHPEMTDDSIKSAVEKAPKNAIVVLEDIDALFTKDRTNRTKASPLTFSGLLNALDGVGSGTGCIFILTTNYREKLDPALIRSGRVDLHVEFKHMCPEQAQAMFAQFYPGATGAQGAAFSEALFAGLEASTPPKTATAAGLQSFFIRARKRTAAEAVATVREDVLRDIAQREEREGEAERTSPSAAAGAAEAAATSVAAAASQPASKSEVHVHVHA